MGTEPPKGAPVPDSTSLSRPVKATCRAPSPMPAASSTSRSRTPPQRALPAAPTSQATLPGMGFIFVSSALRFPAQ